MRLLAAILLLGLVAPTVAADWASFHNDARNSGFVQGSTYPVSKEVWWSNKTLANAQIHASPVVKDGILITADLAVAGLVRALDAESGFTLWTYKMSAPVEGTPAIAGERVYVVDTAGSLKAIGLKTGTLEATASTGVGPTYSSVREHEGKLFIGTEAGEMKAYLSSTLTLLWSFQLSTLYDGPARSAGTGQPLTCGQFGSTTLSPQPIRGAPAVFDGKVFFGSLNHFVVAVDEEGLGNGKTTAKWSFRTGDVVIGAPSITIIDGSTQRLVVGSYDGKVYAFDPSPSSEGSDKCQGFNNPPVWTYEVPSVVDSVSGETQVSKVESSPANSGDKVFFGANNGHVYALKSSDGTLLWDRTAGSSLAPVTSSPAVANNIVVVGSADKNVYWLDANNGNVLKSFPTKSALATSPALDGDKAFIAAQDGTIYMFGPNIPARPDLKVTAISATTAGVTVEVKNVGGAKASNTTVRIELGGAFLGKVELPALEANEAKSATLAATVPAGVNKFRAEADPDNTVKEANESDNALAKDVDLTPPPATVAPVDGGATSGTKKSPAAGVTLIGVLLLGVLLLRKK